MTDNQLLERFVARDDSASFAALMDRHGPRVRRACGRILAEPNDVEDACQATFIILLQKAPALRDPEALGNWLQGVAHRVALRLRRDLARRRRYEQRWAELGPPKGPVAGPWDDLGCTIREELADLPEDYRVPLELCYLRGKSHEQAASDLGWPLGTLKTRIIRGRSKLKDRLGRRGISIGLGLLLFLLRGREAPASSGPSAMGSKPPRPARPGRGVRRLLPIGAALLANPLWVVLLGLTVLLVAMRLFAFFAYDEPLCG